MTEPKYIVGVDLGTTNSVVAYTEAAIEKGKTPDIRVFDIPQLVDAGIVENRSLLPSFVFLPGRHDAAEGALTLPWSVDPGAAVGEFARDRGAEIPKRLISSSKSWLCHTLVDRNKPILPWEGPEDQKKLSPVEASAALLAHIRNAWDFTMAAADENLKLANQDILLTVPASFDAVARDLTVKAAELAGLPDVTLLEEPQAAFYAWIESAGDGWREAVGKGDLILVCDIGGGTSDFSLIRVTEADGDLELERIAVGDHLLVGGDNMDMTLAYTIYRKMAEKGTKLDAWQMRGLFHSCRKAKEKLLADADADQYPVTILGKGSGLIGGTIKTTLEQADVRQVILEGFFPQCDRTATPTSGNKTGIRELGLSYEADPAVTRHLARFLSRQDGEETGPTLPTGVLFNGGVMKSAAVRRRIMDVISGWGDQADAAAPETVREIRPESYDLTVARGAAYYGLVRRGHGIRIRGGLGRSYYIGVAASLPAVPGMPVPLRALCVAPFGMEEGSRVMLKDREFALVVGEPVKFDFLGSSVRIDDAAGAVADDWEDEIEEITTIEATLDGDPGAVIPVFLESHVTEIGTLEIWCVARESDQKWKLEFNVREQAS